MAVIDQKPEKRGKKGWMISATTVFLFLVVLPNSNGYAAADQKVEDAGAKRDVLETGSVRLPDLMQIALENNPEIKAARAGWQAKKKRILQSWALPDPMVGMDVMGENTETKVGPQEQRMVVSQQVPFPLKLWQKRKIAKKEAEAAHQKYLAVKRDVLSRLERAFYSLYEVDGSLNVIHEIHDLLKKFEGVAQARYSNKAGGQRDVAKAQAEVSLTLEQIFTLEQKRETFVALINSLLDRSPLAGLGPAVQPERPREERSFPELVTLTSKNRQEILEMEAMVERNRHAKSLAKLQYFPDVNVGFAYTWVGSGTSLSPEDGKDSWMIPLRINVPLWQNRIIPAIQESQKELEAAQAQLQGTKNEAFYEVKDAYVRFQTAAKITSLYETAVIPQSEIALRSDQSGYESGTTDFLNLLDSERVFLGAKLTYVKIYAEMLRSYTDLRRSTGGHEMGGTQ